MSSECRGHPPGLGTLEMHQAGRPGLGRSGPVPSSKSGAGVRSTLEGRARGPPEVLPGQDRRHHRRRGQTDHPVEVRRRDDRAVARSHPGRRGHGRGRGRAHDQGRSRGPSPALVFDQLEERATDRPGPRAGLLRAPADSAGKTTQNRSPEGQIIQASSSGGKVPNAP